MTVQEAEQLQLTAAKTVYGDLVEKGVPASQGEAVKALMAKHAKFPPYTVRTYTGNVADAQKAGLKATKYDGHGNTPKNGYADLSRHALY